MAKYELTIYGNNDEVIKKHETDVVRWGVYMQALKAGKGIEEKTIEEQFEIVNSFVLKIFPELTVEELEKADGGDVMNTFRQLINETNKIGANQKNAVGAE